MKGTAIRSGGLGRRLGRSLIPLLLLVTLLASPATFGPAPGADSAAQPAAFGELRGGAQYACVLLGIVGGLSIASGNLGGALAATVAADMAGCF